MHLKTGVLFVHIAACVPKSCRPGLGSLPQRRTNVIISHRVAIFPLPAVVSGLVPYLLELRVTVVISVVWAVVLVVRVVGVGVRVVVGLWLGEPLGEADRVEGAAEAVIRLGAGEQVGAVAVLALPPASYIQASRLQTSDFYSVSSEKYFPMVFCYCVKALLVTMETFDR